MTHLTEDQRKQLVLCVQAVVRGQRITFTEPYEAPDCSEHEWAGAQINEGSYGPIFTKDVDNGRVAQSTK